MSWEIKIYFQFQIGQFVLPYYSENLWHDIGYFNLVKRFPNKLDQNISKHGQRVQEMHKTVTSSEYEGSKVCIWWKKRKGQSVYYARAVDGRRTIITRICKLQWRILVSFVEWFLSISIVQSAKKIFCTMCIFFSVLKQGGELLTRWITTSWLMQDIFLVLMC